MGEPQLKQALRDDLTRALKAREQTEVAAIRIVLAAISAAEVSGKQARQLTDEEVIAIVVREVKKCQEGAAAFRSGGRQDSAVAQDAQAEVMRRYLPQAMSPEELHGLVAEAVAQAAAEGLAGGKAMGRVMAQLRQPTAGRIDGSAVADAVKRALGMH